MHFKVYRHTLVAEESLLLTRKFIVLVDDQGFLHFTNFHKFIKNPNRKISLKHQIRPYGGIVINVKGSI